MNSTQKTSFGFIKFEKAAWFIQLWKDCLYIVSSTPLSGAPSVKKSTLKYWRVPSIKLQVLYSLRWLPERSVRNTLMARSFSHHLVSVDQRVSKAANP